MIVVDASAAIDALIPGPRRASAQSELRRADALLAPAIIDAEIVSVFARLARAGAISSSDADFAVTSWVRLPIERIELTGLLPAAWRLRRNVSMADAFYVALAADVGCPLVTSDRKLSRAPVGGVEFRVLG